LRMRATARELKVSTDPVMKENEPPRGKPRGILSVVLV
jgi:hypothetical protein